MHLSRIEIDHFRSLKHLTVNLQTGLNVLVGRNNVGKTNLLQAIRHALGPSASRGDSLWLERDDFYRDSSTDPIERTISITLTFSKLSEAERSYFFEIVEFDLADLSKSTAVIRFEANWPKGKRQASIRRTGGAITTEPAEVPTQILESFPITFLPALRNAEASLAPGHRSRLAVLLRDLAGRDSGAAEIAIKGIYKQANENLEAHPLISTTKTSLQGTTKSLAGSDYSPTAIRAADADFEKILRTLQVQMDGAPIGTIDANGLGYNNLLYMAVVLEHLKSWNSGECPLLLIEEPEAHLHPQLTMLLADYLGTKIETPQTIVTTHSPTLAASVPPSQVHVLFRGQIDQQLQCNSIAKAAMDQKEQRSLQRMMDITRATLYFAKAAILVEGVSESLLLPVLANRLGHDMAKLHVSVIPICGVAFPTFKKLLDSKVLGIPIAIVTDADPDQAIYEFNGAQPDQFGTFQALPGAQTLFLANSLRCPEAVCRVAAHLKDSGGTVGAAQNRIGRALLIHSDNMLEDIRRLVKTIPRSVNRSKVKIIARGRTTVDYLTGRNSKNPKSLFCPPLTHVFGN